MSPLQLWVEADAPEPGQPDREPVQRVLLGLHFSRLGETRVGLLRTTSSIQIRIWSEHPDDLLNQREILEHALKSLDRPAELHIQALPSGSPSLRALVTGSSLHALG
jgi:hypothetical protein